MRITLIIQLIFLSYHLGLAQEMTGIELLDKAIEYHDPHNRWDAFDGLLNVTMQSPDKPARDSEIIINLPEEYFYVKAQRASNTTEFTVDKNECNVQFNGTSTYTPEEVKKHGLNCEQANLYKNYYTYLYGLPMKLRDPGTTVADKIERKTFQGKEYLVLKVTYDEAVGSDVWFFYFNPENYAMEVYQFFKTKEDGTMDPSTGEYILLEGEARINGIKIPKDRAWYYNKDDGYLGTDYLNK